MKIRVENLLWPRRHLYFFPIEQYEEYEGDEIAVKWVTQDQLALTTGLPDFTFRVIERSRILAIDDQPYEYKKALVKSGVKLVKGSKGQTYEVTANSCTCAGFTFRGSCRHIKEYAHA